MHKLTLMLAELESNQLVTILAPSKRHDRREWDCIRVNVSENPKWYRTMCGENLSKRGSRRGKPDTVIRRSHTLRALERMLRGSRQGRYEERILAVMPRVKL